MRNVLTGKVWRWRAAALFLTSASPPRRSDGEMRHTVPIARGAAVILPDEIPPFFLVNSDFLARHATDPDYIPTGHRRSAPSISST